LHPTHLDPGRVRNIRVGINASKFCDAVVKGEGEVIVWGTGKATREFQYVEDAAEGIVLATERYFGTEPVNLGTGFEGEIVWDSTKPDGQPRRKLDTSRSEQLFNYRAKTSLDEGLKKTISWYKENVLKVKKK